MSRLRAMAFAAAMAITVVAVPALSSVALPGLVASAAAAVFEEREFADEAQRARYKALIYELRCLVCQNQNLADSDADLAADLRREIHRMIVDGESDEAIIDFMVARYGDFVLYRPPLTAKTVLLWSGPFILGIAGLALLFVNLKRRRSAEPTPLTADERKRLDALLEENRQ